MATTPTSAQQPAQNGAQNNTGRIKYADPRTLPSFPSSGLAPNGAAASAAASLGWSNQRSIDVWKPDPSPSASTAAVLAKYYKMSPQWEPSAHSDGHKAAMLAVGSAGAALRTTTTPRSLPAQDSWGNSAATQAFHANRPQSAEPVSLTYGSSAATEAFRVNRSHSMKKLPRPRTPPGDRSLVAAKGAMNRPVSSLSASGLRDVYASEASAAASALNGATLAHEQAMKSKPGLGEVGSVSVTTMARNMFTSHPPVKPEVDERTYNEKIHQSAVEMAKKMYARQRHIGDQTKDAHADEPASTQSNQYTNLQDAAYRQAQARLAKLHDEYHQSREYHEYYGKERSHPKHRFSISNKLRRRGSDSDINLSDREQSEKIREQMTMFSSKLSQVDKAKREKDREAVLAAAQRNVKERLHGMDEKVYQETGRANPTLVTDWEAKAQKAAQSRHEIRSEHKGEVDIGGGMFMTQDEINDIASKRVQPLLDDINDKAENERQRQQIMKLEEQTRREEAEKDKIRDREAKDIVRKTKEQDKQEEKARKDEEKASRDAEKAAKGKQKHRAAEKKGKSKLTPAAAAVASLVTPDTQAAQAQPSQPAGEATTSRDPWPQRGNEPEAGLTGNVITVETKIEATSFQRKTDTAASPTSKVKGWIKNRFSRGKSIGEKDDKRRSFFGGAAMKEPAGNGSTTSIEHRSTSMHDVAIAGKDGEESHPVVGATGHADDVGGESSHQISGQDSQGVSPVSTPLEEERQLGDGVEPREEHVEEEDARQSRSASIEPPRPIEDPAIRSSSSPTRDSRFREEMDH